MTMKNNFPKILAAVLVGCFAASVQAQQGVATETTRPNDARITFDRATGQPLATESLETRFDLNFKGGTPRQLIEAVNAKSGLKLNVIIPNEEANAQLPAIEVSSVTVPRLFHALTEASRKETNVITGGFYGRPNDGPPIRLAQPTFVRQGISQGFRTSDNPATEYSIWYFYVERPLPPPTFDLNDNVTVQVYQLAQLLKDYSIDDITTAVKTTWQMLESSITPELKYHSDTGLLIAKGTDAQLRIVTEVLVQLRIGKPSTDGQTSIPLPVRPPANANN